MMSVTRMARGAANALALYLVCLLASPAASAQGGCAAAPDYSCLIAYARATADGIERVSDEAQVLSNIAAAFAGRR